MNITPTKQCGSCMRQLPQTAYYLHPISRPYARCKTCMIEKRKRLYRADPQATKDSTRRSRVRTKAGEGA